MYGLGKLSILKLFEKSKAARVEADVFLQKNSSPEAVDEAGKKLFVLLYGGKNSDSLTYLRYLKYMKMTSSAANVKPESLPPTGQSAMFHIYRVFFQLHEWNTLMESTLDPKDWGWRLEDDSLVPVMTDQEPAPDELLKVIRCNCKVTSKNLCNGKQCSCRSNGLKCVAACGGCRGTECQNCNSVELFEDEENNVEDEFDNNLFDNVFG